MNKSNSALSDYVYSDTAICIEKCKLCNLNKYVNKSKQMRVIENEFEMNIAAQNFKFKSKHPSQKYYKYYLENMLPTPQRMKQLYNEKDRDCQSKRFISDLIANDTSIIIEKDAKLHYINFENKGQKGKLKTLSHSDKTSVKPLGTTISQSNKNCFDCISNRCNFCSKGCIYGRKFICQPNVQSFRSTCESAKPCSSSVTSLSKNSDNSSSDLSATSKSKTSNPSTDKNSTESTNLRSINNPSTDKNSTESTNLRSINNPSTDKNSIESTNLRSINNPSTDKNLTESTNRCSINNPSTDKNSVESITLDSASSKLSFELKLNKTEEVSSDKHTSLQSESSAKSESSIKCPKTNSKSVVEENLPITNSKTVKGSNEHILQEILILRSCATNETPEETETIERIVNYNSEISREMLKTCSTTDGKRKIKKKKKVDPCNKTTSSDQRYSKFKNSERRIKKNLLQLGCSINKIENNIDKTSSENSLNSRCNSAVKKKFKKRNREDSNCKTKIGNKPVAHPEYVCARCGCDISNIQINKKNCREKSGDSSKSKYYSVAEKNCNNRKENDSTQAKTDKKNPLQIIIPNNKANKNEYTDKLQSDELPETCSNSAVKEKLKKINREDSYYKRKFMNKHISQPEYVCARCGCDISRTKLNKNIYREKSGDPSKTKYYSVAEKNCKNRKETESTEANTHKKDPLQIKNSNNKAKENEYTRSNSAVKEKFKKPNREDSYYKTKIRNIHNSQPEYVCAHCGCDISSIKINKNVYREKSGDSSKLQYGSVAEQNSYNRKENDSTEAKTDEKDPLQIIISNYKAKKNKNTHEIKSDESLEFSKTRSNSNVKEKFKNRNKEDSLNQTKTFNDHITKPGFPYVCCYCDSSSNQSKNIYSEKSKDPLITRSNSFLEKKLKNGMKEDSFHKTKNSKHHNLRDLPPKPINLAYNSSKRIGAYTRNEKSSLQLESPIKKTKDYVINTYKTKSQDSLDSSKANSNSAVKEKFRKPNRDDSYYRRKFMNKHISQPEYVCDRCGCDISNKKIRDNIQREKSGDSSKPQYNSVVEQNANSRKKNDSTEKKTGEKNRLQIITSNNKPKKHKNTHKTKSEKSLKSLKTRSKSNVKEKFKNRNKEDSLNQTKTFMENISKAGFPYVCCCCDSSSDQSKNIYNDKSRDPSKIHSNSFFKEKTKNGKKEDLFDKTKFSYQRKSKKTETSKRNEKNHSQLFISTNKARKHKNTNRTKSEKSLKSLKTRSNLSVNDKFQKPNRKDSFNKTKIMNKHTSEPEYACACCGCDISSKKFKKREKSGDSLKPQYHSVSEPNSNNRKGNEKHHLQIAISNKRVRRKRHTDKTKSEKSLKSSKTCSKSAVKEKFKKPNRKDSFNKTKVMNISSNKIKSIVNRERSGDSSITQKIDELGTQHFSVPNINVKLTESEISIFETLYLVSKSVRNLKTLYVKENYYSSQ